jgi:hypothetical protein
MLLIEERELTRQAEEMSHEIIRQAQAEGDEIRRGADAYAAEVLFNLESDLMRTLKSVKLGLDLLNGKRAATEAPTAAASQGAVDEHEQAGKQPVRG